MNKHLTDLEILHIEEKAKFALLRIEKHIEDFNKIIRTEIEDVVSDMLKLQKNGVDKQKKGDDDV